MDQTGGLGVTLKTAVEITGPDGRPLRLVIAEGETLDYGDYGPVVFERMDGARPVLNMPEVRREELPAHRIHSPCVSKPAPAHADPPRPAGLPPALARRPRVARIAREPR
jgi:hypothetical protein